MHPPFNSIPYQSSQIRTNGTTVSDAQPVRPSNHCQGNPSNFLPNAQIQPQMGIINPQMAFPFNNSNTHLSNGNVAMPIRPVLPNTSCFMNAPNQFFPLQNCMPPLGSAGALSHSGQLPIGFCPQNFPLNFPQNFNPIVMNQMISSQPNGQFFAHNSVNPIPFFNQNVSLPNGPFCLQSPMQNMSQFAQMQMPNYTQVGSGNLPLFQTQVSQGMGPQNSTFGVNQQFGLVHSNGVVQHSNQEPHRLIPPTMDMNESKQSPNTTQQVQGNSSLQPDVRSAQPQQTQNFHPPIFAKSQGNPGKDNGVNNINNNWKSSQNRNFTRHKKIETSRKGFMKSQFHHAQKPNGKFRFHSENGGKEYNNDRARKSGLANSTNQTQVEKKRSVSLNYTEQEIQHWHEERKKNYPSKANMEKKLTQKLTQPEVTYRDAELRRQQLKEILSKQAELGCEVAEIPSYYLADSEKQVHGREENKLGWSNKGRFQNKFNKRGGFHQNGRFAKKKRSANHDSSNVNDQNVGFGTKQILANNNSSSGRPKVNKREPTLLQKLLSADVRRDKSRLLQVFRFMVMNSFFKDWPNKSLRLPLVIVNENGGEGEAVVVENKSYQVRKGDLEGSETPVIKKLDDEGGDNGDNGDETDAKVKEAGGFGREEGSIGEEVAGAEEEEGEIID